MDAKEFRIGNWIIEDSTIYDYGTTKEERQITSADFSVRDKDWSDHWDMIKGVPISPERFLQLGFQPLSDQDWFRKKNIIISILGEIKLVTWDEKVFKIDPILEYIHQLQNLYHSLTGEELTRKTA